MRNNAKCPECEQGYVMGWNGTVNGCDKCLGIVRDSNGYTWHPGEKHQDYQDVSTGIVFRVARRSALNPKAGNANRWDVLMAELKTFEMICVVCGNPCTYVAVNSLHPYPRPVHIDCFKKEERSKNWFEWFESIVFEASPTKRVLDASPQEASKDNNQGLHQ